MHKVQMNSSEQVRVVGTVTIYSDFVDFKKSVSEQLLQNVVGSRAKLKFKWLSDNKVEVRTTCSAADAHKIELLIESCDVTKMVAWSSSANSNRKVSDEAMRKVQMNSSAGCDDYVKLSTATLKRKLKNATPEEKKCIQAELNARGVYSKRSVNSAETSSVGPCFAALWPAYIDDEYECACCGKRFPAGHNSVSLGGHKPDGMHFIFEYTKENRVGNSVNYDPYNLPPEDPEGGIFKVLVGEDADEEGYRWLNFCRNCWPKLTSMSPEDIYAKYSPAINSSKSCNSSATRYLDKNGIMGVPGEEWTYKELAEYWYREQGNDPVLSEYDSFDTWIADTIDHMTPLDSSRKLNSANDPESPFYTATDAAYYFLDKDFTLEQIERYLKRKGYSDKWIRNVFDLMDEYADEQEDFDMFNSSRKHVNSNRKVGNNSMRKVIFRGKLNSSRNPKYTAYSISDLGALEDEYGYGPGELVDVVKQGEAAIGGKFLGFTNDDNMYFVFEEDGKPVAYEQSHDRWFPVNSSRKRTNSSRKRVNSSHRKLNSAVGDITADDDVQDTGIDGGDTATETAEILDDALIVQNPETKEVSLFVATEDDEVLPESVDVIAEVTPVVEDAVLDSSRRLKRFAAAKLNSSKGCLNSDAEDVCPACGNPVSECTCEPGTVAYDEIQLPDDTVVEVENILVVQGEDDDLGLFMPETADEAVPDEYEVVAIANPVAEAEVLDSSRRMKKSNSKKLNSSVKKKEIAEQRKA